jgi:hypothetical protein
VESVDQLRRERYDQICAAVPKDGDRDGNHPSDCDTLSEAEQRALLYWVREAITGATRFERRTGYGLKHDFEREGFYITNGQLKGALLWLGYEPKQTRELNWVFRIKPRVARRSDDDHGGRSAVEGYSLGRFDKEFASLLLAAGHLMQGPQRS